MLPPTLRKHLRLTAERPAVELLTAEPSEQLKLPKLTIHRILSGRLESVDHIKNCSSSPDLFELQLCTSNRLCSTDSVGSVRPRRIFQLPNWIRIIDLLQSTCQLADYR